MHLSLTHTGTLVGLTPQIHLINVLWLYEGTLSIGRGPVSICQPLSIWRSYMGDHGTEGPRVDATKPEVAVFTTQVY